jgi:hypothetical protein
MEGSNCPALRRQERHQELLWASEMAKSATGRPLWYRGKTDEAKEWQAGLLMQAVRISLAPRGDRSPREGAVELLNLLLPLIDLLSSDLSLNPNFIIPSSFPLLPSRESLHSIPIYSVIPSHRYNFDTPQTDKMASERQSAPYVPPMRCFWRTTRPPGPHHSQTIVMPRPVANIRVVASVWAQSPPTSRPRPPRAPSTSMSSSATTGPSCSPTPRTTPPCAPPS